ncbi:thioesterase II family protein [Roseivirga sp. BDSF3-8]|uniref:thioesterase II family protein n=1 Tax=Roseivirga sp. BDSF3-8 TaxID=3241598 RepID=UPI00353269B8
MKKKIPVFCIPFAGGSAYSFSAWKNVTPRGLEFKGLELPGHGKRIREPLLTHYEDMVDDLLDQIEIPIDMPYVIYGHSLGAMLAYHVVQRLQERGYKLPMYLVVSGRRGPSVELTNRSKYQLPQKEFYNMLKRENGAPREVLEDPEMMTYFEPILRADYKASETYEHPDMPMLRVPILAMAGDDEEATLTEVKAWQAETSTPIVVKQFPGHHFFIFENKEKVMRLMANTLQHELSARHPEL